MKGGDAPPFLIKPLLPVNPLVQTLTTLQVKVIISAGESGGTGIRAGFRIQCPEGLGVRVPPLAVNPGRKDGYG